MDRSQKGKSIIAFPRDFTIIDVETTGHDPNRDVIIEFAAIRVHGGVISDPFQTLINPGRSIDREIEELTGISNADLSGAPCFCEVVDDILRYVGDDIIIGHSVSFDINFLYDAVFASRGIAFSNDHVDTLRMSRKLFPDLEHHRLCDVAAAFGFSPKISHRALSDCETTLECYRRILQRVFSTVGVDEFIKSFEKKSNHYPSTRLDLKSIVSESDDIDESHPLYGKRCVFTGTLEKLSRPEAAQIVVNLGGIVDNGITKKTNFLIVSADEYCSTIAGEKSGKQKKAEEYIQQGVSIEILQESAFYEIIGYGV